MPPEGRSPRHPAHFMILPRSSWPLHPLLRFPCDRFDGRLASTPSSLSSRFDSRSRYQGLGRRNLQLCHFRRLPTAARQPLRRPSDGPPFRFARALSLGRRARFPCDRHDGGSRRRGRERCRRSAFRAFPIACGPFRGRLGPTPPRPGAPAIDFVPRSGATREASRRAPGDARCATFGSTSPGQVLRQTQGLRAPRGAAGKAGLPRCQTAGRVRGKRFRPIEAP